MNKHYCTTLSSSDLDPDNLQKPDTEVFGLIDNIEDLRNCLGLSSRARSAEVITELYRIYGAEFRHLAFGSYVAIIRDYTKRSVFVFRDASDLAPIYYCDNGSSVTIASTVGAIKQLHSTSQLSLSFIADFLSEARSFSGHTIYEDICRVQPRQILSFGSRGVQLSFDAHRRDPGFIEKCPKDLAEEFVHLLGRATGLTNSDAVFELSGGLDSSSLVCLAAHLKQAPVHTLSVVYSKSTTADERSWIEQIDEGRRGQTVFLDEDEFLPMAYFPRELVDHPHVAMLSYPLLNGYRQVMAKNGFSEIVSGMGGDQVCYAAEPSALMSIDAIKRPYSRQHWGGFGAVLDIENRTRPARYLARTQLIPGAKNYFSGRRIGETQDRHQNCPWVTNEFARQHGLYDKRRNALRPVSHLASLQEYDETLSVISYSMDQHWTEFTDDLSFRFPFLYPPLVEFMSRLSYSWRSSWKSNRLLQREAMKGLLPDCIRTRQSKRGPDEAFFRGLSKNKRLREYLAECPSLARLGIVDVKKWRTALDRASMGEVPKFSGFFSTICLELWINQAELANLDAR